MNRPLRRSKSGAEALSALMRLCARAERSSGDALRLMRTWGVPEQERAGVLAELRRQRFIDDGRYAAAFVRDKLNLSGWGPGKIRSALAAKGIAPEVIAGALEQCEEPLMAERLEAMLRRKRSALKGGTPFERRGKLMRYGLSLGYGFEAVREQVERLIEADD